MHIPPFYKKTTWQAFFIGILTGVVIGYMFFLYVYGQHTERWIEENLTLRNELNQVKQENELLKQDKDDLNRANEERLTIQDIELDWHNADELDLDRFTLHELNENVLQELQTVMGRNIQSVSDQRELLIRTIENKLYNIRDIRYQLEVHHITISTTLIITVKVHITSS
ncbi:sporulation membrane protein YtrI [Alkalibacillus haloalkaliphilus]|uniref:sporulation membrane protein YtrI n=1 Tax=Alkalibacillus haloalkaliphilus TaxID=94136 RepID=UPI0002FE64DC|nr:sporulation membrane protein YtrI [Alkalibacillus haloalkaliphilus]